MISEMYCNSVYYSAKLPEVCPKTFQSVTTILDKYGVPHSGLLGTKDIWVRDFMPIQNSRGKLLSYNYSPDYLRDDKQYVHTISDPIEVCKANGIPVRASKANGFPVNIFSADRISANNFPADSVSADNFSADSVSADNFSADSVSADNFSADRISANDFSAEGNFVDDSFKWIRLDGGNVLHFGEKAILTAKVVEENPGVPASVLLKQLEKMLQAEVILLPWDVNEEFGHADGIVRFVDSDTVIMTNYSQFDKSMAARFRNILNANFKNVYELHFNVKKLNENSWAYINWLQTDKVLVLPTFGIAEDEQAFRQIENWMPDYKGRIEMADATDLVKHKGCLNCATWTIRQH